MKHNDTIFYESICYSAIIQDRIAVRTNTKFVWQVSLIL